MVCDYKDYKHFKSYSDFIYYCRFHGIQITENISPFGEDTFVRSLNTVTTRLNCNKKYTLKYRWHYKL